MISLFKISCCFFFLLNFIEVQAQSFADAYKHAFNSFDDQNIAYKLEYISLSGKDTVFHDLIEVKNYNGQSYSSIGEVESFAFDSTSVVIDHESKTILLNEGQAIKQQGGLLERLELISQLEDKAIKVVVDSNRQNITYRLHFSGLQFSEIEFALNKKDGSFQYLTMTPAVPVVSSEDDETLPITKYLVYLKKIEKNKVPASDILLEYLKVGTSGKYELKSKYSTYQYTNNYEWR